ncbi:MAG: hypothetical protein Q4C45_07620 [Oscillospiraceae bacterium]|nr:hypothetical protein [Oscillospiraceae bacterium]
MTGLMQTLFDYILDNLVENYLPGPPYLKNAAALETQDTALQKLLTPEQQAALEKLRAAEHRRDLMELEAMFQATWAVARELG